MKEIMMKKETLSWCLAVVLVCIFLAVVLGVVGKGLQERNERVLQEIDAAFVEGQEAYHLHLRIEANPYKPGYRTRLSWHNGYLEEMKKESL